jgi:ribose-phosphate pyrophosphokinase
VGTGLRAPVCVAVHALFSDTAEQALRGAGAANIVTTTSVPHPTNLIDVVPLMIAPIRELC